MPFYSLPEPPVWFGTHTYHKANLALCIPEIATWPIWVLDNQERSDMLLWWSVIFQERGQAMYGNEEH
jgi:hypothetical protein